MEFFETVRVALTSLHTNRLRSSLTILGIIVGIFSIIAVSTVISMLQNSIEDGISFFGKNTFSIQKWPAVRTGGHGDMGKFRNRKNITLDEFYDLKEKLVEAKSISTESSRGGLTAKYGNIKTNPNIIMLGTTPEGFITRDWNVESGRAVNLLDMRSSRNVVVLGKDLEAKLFKNIDAVGQEIWINKYKLTVIGVLEKQGDIFGQSLDNYSIMPLSTYNKMFGNRRESLSISVMAHSKEQYDDLMMKTTGYLRTIRKVAPGEENDFEVISNASIIAQINSITSGIRIGAFVIAAIALVAAGVGIMNIMLVSVTDRTREIGIRKSIGAKKKNILFQFLIEAVTLCLLGGLVGIILGIATGNFIGSLINLVATIPIDWIAIGIFLCISIGIVFGTYPAFKAANLDPIEALRHE